MAPCERTAAARRRATRARAASSPFAATTRIMPAAVKTALTTAGLPLTNATSFVLGRMGDDFGYTDNISKTDVLRALAGLKGSITDNWTWDGVLPVRRDELRPDRRRTIASSSRWPGVPLATGQATRIQLAADAVVNPANGQIVCRSTLDQSDQRLPARESVRHQQLLAGREGLSVRHGHADSGVQAARGRGERAGRSVPHVGRRGADRGRCANIASNKVDTTADPISATSGFYVFNSSIVGGDVKVKEGYLETAVPLAKDMTALRVAGPERRRARDGLQHQSAASPRGSMASTYEPLSWLRFRATRSRDIRAPNTDELFRPRTTAFQTVDGILTPTQSAAVAPDLTPESADTITAGFAIRGAGLFDGVRASVDYYDIDVDQRRCHTHAATAGEPLPHARRVLRPGGLQCRTARWRRCARSFQNLNRLQTKGVDIELNYTHGVGVRARSTYGVLATRLMALATTDVTGPHHRSRRRHGQQRLGRWRGPAEVADQQSRDVREWPVVRSRSKGASSTTGCSTPR